MKLHKIIFVSLLVCLLASLAAVPVSAEGSKTPVEGYIIMIPIPPEFGVDPVDVVTPIGPKKLLDEGYSYDIVDIGDPRLVGNEFWDYRIMMPLDGRIGHWEGSLTIFTAGGTWEGTFTGTLDGYEWVCTANMVGRGAYTGLMAKLTYVGWQDGTCWNCPWDVTGYIVERGPSK